MARKRGKGPGRSYARLTRAERNSIERMLDRGESCRAIARELGRSPSTVSDEVARHRFVTSPKPMAGQPAPEGLGESCPRLAGWPRCCNGCAKRGGYGCSRKPKAFYGARAAQEAADRELSEARRGLDEDEAVDGPQARRHQGGHIARDVAGPGKRMLRGRAGGLAVHGLPLGGRGLRRDDQPGAAPQGGLPQEVAVGPEEA